MKARRSNHYTNPSGSALLFFLCLRQASPADPSAARPGEGGGGRGVREKSEKKTAPRAGLEPATFRLTAERTANCAIEASGWDSHTRQRTKKKGNLFFLREPKIGLDRD